MAVRMQRLTSHLLLLFCIVLSLIVPVAVSAGNITVTFSDLNMGSSTQIQIYAPDAPYNESLIGTFNATDTVSLEGESNYVFVLKPGPQHWFENPVNSLEFLNLSLPIWASYLLWGAVIAGGLFLLTRVFR